MLIRPAETDWNYRSSEKLEMSLYSSIRKNYPCSLSVFVPYVTERSKRQNRVPDLSPVELLSVSLIGSGHQISSFPLWTHEKKSETCSMTRCRKFWFPANTKLAFSCVFDGLVACAVSFSGKRPGRAIWRQTSLSSGERELDSKYRNSSFGDFYSIKERVHISLLRIIFLKKFQSYNSYYRKCCEIA